MQRTEKRPTARRATAGLAVANFSERNNGDGRLSARPQGAHPIGQCGDAYRDVGNEREHAYREVGGRAMQGAIAEGRGSVAALGKDRAIAGGRRLALTDGVGSAPVNIPLQEY